MGWNRVFQCKFYKFYHKNLSLHPDLIWIQPRLNLDSESEKYLDPDSMNWDPKLAKMDENKYFLNCKKLQTCYSTV
jgi:hypothetical protein